MRAVTSQSPDGVRVMPPAGMLDSSLLITHDMSLDRAAEAYALYDSREASNIILTP